VRKALGQIELALLTDDQRAAIAFLEAVRDDGDGYLAEQAERALGYWRDR